MKSKLMFLVLFSFAIVACENIFDKDKDDDKDSRLLQTMQRMSESIDKVNTTNDPDQDFALKMKIHHRGAIEMANFEILRGDVVEVLAIADSIIEKQTMEIAHLDSFLNEHTVLADSINGKGFNDASEDAMVKLDSTLKVKTLNYETDHDFLVLMIEHHKNAIDLGEAELEFGKDEELKAMVTKMNDDAAEEIQQLEELLQENN